MTFIYTEKNQCINAAHIIRVDYPASDRDRPTAVMTDGTTHELDADEWNFYQRSIDAHHYPLLECARAPTLGKTTTTSLHG